VNPLRRAGRRTNLALLVVLVAAFATGWLAFAAGQPISSTLATTAHGLLGLAVVALVPWKTVIVRRAPALRLASLLLVATIVICLAAGFVEVFAGYGTRAGLSPIQVHVGSAVVAVGLLGWHLLRHRRQRPRRGDLSRRRLLTAGLFAVGVGAGSAALAGVGRLAGSPSASRLPTGSHRLDPDRFPATIWLFDQVPAVAGMQQVTVAGRPLSVSVLDAQATVVTARLDCTSGWYAEATWTGVPLDVLLDPAELAAAASIEVTSTTGYRRRFPSSEAASLWLATRLEGRPLAAGQGAPVRLVAPGRRGFWWVKWVASVELSGLPPAAQSPFPLQ
jgi:hypothetical protein